MPQLDVSTFSSQLFWLILSFSLLYLLLSKLCLPSLNKILEERDSKISDALKRAHQAKTEAERVKAEYQAILTHAAQNKNLMLDKAMKDLSNIADEKLAEHDKKCTKMIKASEKKMQDFEVSSKENIAQVAKDASNAILTDVFGIKSSEESITKTLQEVRGSYDV
jgi:F-type H+-transporting ATPase subunit b